LADKDIGILAEKIQQSAIRAGADDAESIVRRSDSMKLEIKDGKLEGVQRREETSVALRVLKEGRIGFAFTTAPKEDRYGLLVSDAMESARLMPSLSENRFSDVAVHAPPEGLYDPIGLGRSFDEKKTLAVDMEEAVLGVGGKVYAAHKSSYHEQSRETSIASGGQTWSCEDTVFSLSIEAIAKHGGESQSGHEYRASKRLSDIDPVEVGQTAAGEAIDLLGGGRPPTGTFPAIFPPKVALDLLVPLIFSFSAEEMIKKRSRLAGRRGEKVFSGCLTIFDDGTLPWMTGTIPFDDERVPPVPRKLVDAGVVSGCLHSLKTSAVMSEQATGNGFRPAMTSAPVPGPSNFFIENGLSPVEGIAPSGRSVRFSSLMGAHTIDQVSGDFSLGASGHLLEGGEVVSPFRNGTVSGNLYKLMGSLEATGNDLTFYGSMGSPTLLFGSVVVSGM
jgi:PmbA protein